MSTRLPVYAHQNSEWPHFRWDSSAFDVRLADIHFRRGALITAMASLGFDIRQETVLSVLVQDVTKSSEIEGEHLDAAQVRSSIAQRLGMDVAGLPPAARHVEGVVEMLLDATGRFGAPLDAERLFGWHSALFPTGRSNLRRIIVGGWRDDREGPMMVLSGPLDRQRVHFEAPAAERVPHEMDRFLTWFDTAQLDPVVRAAVAHLWFVTIHPFDDGNGRIARAITDLALARADGTSQRFYSMSAQIERERRAYYDALENTQRGGVDITGWIVWFLDQVFAALQSAEGVLDKVRSRQAFWDLYRDVLLNGRQIKVLGKMLEGLNSKLRSSKYAALAGCSQPTAVRDLSDLVSKGILKVDPAAAGRSTSYILNFN
ncbi:Fic family protein [Deinococcus deserti]|uniref:Putative filamentation induced by cAMP protein Fic n=1 Tax=Deinococcus deserti (strain DSM 17065 / CIP 109153 / LMG 22923 / VCD115) TaxID=546414 RepID=C1D3F5_DEIDV|nr:Fic family protein [Deinococcus deserti]ACO48034.2 putative filamentation induced by cAMP protein Fic [Deinococcus deserti VCD115]